MATIELDIIKQRSEKLMPSEKRELIEYLLASLPPEDVSQIQKSPDFDAEDREPADKGS